MRAAMGDPETPLLGKESGVLCFSITVIIQK